MGSTKIALAGWIMDDVDVDAARTVESYTRTAEAAEMPICCRGDAPSCTHVAAPETPDLARVVGVLDAVFCIDFHRILRVGGFIGG